MYSPWNVEVKLSHLGLFTLYRNDFHSGTSSFHLHVFICICLHDTETKFYPVQVIPD